MPTLGFWVDLGLILIILVLGIIFYFKGFLKSIVKWFGALFSLVCAVFLAKPFALLLVKLPFHNNIIIYFDSLYAKAPAFNSVISVGESAQISSIFTAMNFPEFLSNFIANQLIPLSNGEALSTILSMYTVNIIYLVFSAILIFFTLKLVVSLLKKLINSLLKDKLINAFDRMLGFVFGGAWAILFVMIILSVAASLKTQQFMTETNRAINDSQIVKALYDENPVRMLYDKYVDSEMLIKAIKDKLGT